MGEKIHLIAIGGSIMHNLALALRKQGAEITGSDDQIFEPAKSRLQAAGLLPEKFGWDPDKINSDLDAVILGMHAKEDNPELLKAQALKLNIVSFPEYMFQAYSSKLRVSIAGSHGKTTTTSMLMHVLKCLGLKFDYLVGAQIDGFQNMVQISDAPIAILESDEYLSSCLDLRPKFLHYNPKISVITGIAWDHYNVFPTLHSYHKAFIDFLESLDSDSIVYYFLHDTALKNMIETYGKHINCIPYDIISHKITNGKVDLEFDGQNFQTQIFGEHNLQNMEAVHLICKSLNISELDIYKSLASFKGSKKRMELIYSSFGREFYIDFAHSPSKVRATVKAFSERFRDSKILIILELHTYSSLNVEFLPQYSNSLANVDQAIVYFDKQALELKNMPMIDKDFILSAFNRSDLLVCNKKEELLESILKLIPQHQIIVFMGSGHFGGLDIKSIISNFEA